MRPADEAELAELVAGAGRVKVAGAGHSFTDIACTDGVMVDLSRMSRVLGVEGNEVAVEGGITIRELGPALAERGLALENRATSIRRRSPARSRPPRTARAAASRTSPRR